MQYRNNVLIQDNDDRLVDDSNHSEPLDSGLKEMGHLKLI